MFVEEVGVRGRGELGEEKEKEGKRRAREDNGVLCNCTQSSSTRVIFEGSGVGFELELEEGRTLEDGDLCEEGRGDGPGAILLRLSERFFLMRGMIGSISVMV